MTNITIFDAINVLTLNEIPTTVSNISEATNFPPQYVLTILQTNFDLKLLVHGPNDEPADPVQYDNGKTYHFVTELSDQYELVNHNGYGYKSSQGSFLGSSSNELSVYGIETISQDDFNSLLLFIDLSIRPLTMGGTIAYNLENHFQSVKGITFKIQNIGTFDTNYLDLLLVGYMRENFPDYLDLNGYYTVESGVKNLITKLWKE